MRFALFTLLFVAGLLVSGLAQPQPCGVSPEMTSFCGQACIICDINGFTGINDDPAKGQAPPGFCTSTVHHAQWIGFIAGTTTLKIEVRAFNCRLNRGLEVGIYRSLDCQNFQLVSNCDGDIAANTAAVFTNTVPLVVGQYYYFVMDGNQNDVCNYTIRVLEGSTQVAKLDNSGSIRGSESACSGLAAKYTVRPPKGATWFSWTLDGLPFRSGVDTTVSIDFIAPGQHQLCVTPSNVCDTAAPICRLIDVKPLPMHNIAVALCQGECFTGADTTLCEAGLYQLLRSTPSGCDSLVQVLIAVLPAYRVNLSRLICRGDTLRIGSRAFSQTGQFTERLLTHQGCDSTINLDLRVVVCDIKSQLKTEAVSCGGGADGKLRLLVNDATPPVHYEWTHNTISGTGDFPGLNTEVVLQGLPLGLYRVRIYDDYGHETMLTDSILGPPPLDGAFQKSDFQGNNVSCAGAQNGSLRFTPAGGVPPYTLQWSTGATTAALTNLGAGRYTCTITDAKGCTFVAATLLQAPQALALEAAFLDPDCSGQNTGMARATSLRGGTPPYIFGLSGIGLSVDSVFRALGAGAYTFSVRDANGCMDSVSGFLHARTIPTLTLASSPTIELGESIPLRLVANTPIDTYTWTPAEGLSCANCPNPIAMPFVGTTYTVVAVAPGGCLDTDSVRVEVLDRRRVYVPNTFSPNDDGNNDYFTVFGGPEVRQILRLEVWSRWGELVFSARNTEPNDERAGWDGHLNGKPLPTGVFFWTAAVDFVDGRRAQYQGDVTIVR